MKHIHQESGECVLATLAMLTNERYEDVQLIAYDLFPFQIGKGYYPYHSSAIFSQFGLQYPFQSDYDNAKKQKLDLKSLDLKDEGFLLLKNPHNLAWHCVAYSENMVFDGECSRSLSVKKYIVVDPTMSRKLSMLQYATFPKQKHLNI